MTEDYEGNQNILCVMHSPQVIANLEKQQSYHILSLHETSYCLYVHETRSFIKRDEEMLTVLKGGY